MIHRIGKVMMALGLLSATAGPSEACLRVDLERIFVLGYTSDEVYTLRLTMNRSEGGPGTELTYDVRGAVERVGWSGEQTSMPSFNVPNGTLEQVDRDFLVPLADYLARVADSLRREVGAFTVARVLQQVACDPARECEPWRLSSLESELEVHSSRGRGTFPLADLAEKSTQDEFDDAPENFGDAFDLVGWAEVDLGSRRGFVVTIGTGDKRRFSPPTEGAECDDGEICATIPGTFFHGENYDLFLIEDVKRWEPTPTTS